MLQFIKKFIKSMTKEDYFILTGVVGINIIYDIVMWIYFKI